MTMTDEPLDDLLFRFHCEARGQKVTPSLIAKWTSAYPQHAADIREHAVELMDMEFRAHAQGAVPVASQTRAQAVSPIPSVTTIMSGTAPTTLREALKSVGLSLREFADDIDIARSIISDINAGEIVKETIPRRFMRIGAGRAGRAADWFREVVQVTEEKGAAPAFKSKGDPLPGRQRTWEEAIRDTDMDPERIAFWLSDEE